MVNIEQDNGILNVSYVNTNGDIDIHKINLKSPSNNQMFEWTPDNPKLKRTSYFKSWDTNANLKKRNARYISKWRQIEILEQLPKNERDKIYQFNVPKKYFVDIETMVDGEFPEPSIARHEVTAISFVYDQQIVVMGTKQLSTSEISEIEVGLNKYVGAKGYAPYNFTFLYYKSETSMMADFFARQIQKMPLLTGWNFIKFDWAYLINRCKKLGIDPTQASPVGKLSDRDNLPIHKIIVDYLEIYKKWDYGIFKENNTLDYVATMSTGLGKIKFSGSFDDLFEKNYVKYIYYNAIDSVLVQLIDRKINTMSIFLHLGNITNTPLDRVFSPIALTENVLVRKYLSDGLVIPYTKNNEKKAQYEGAYVFKPIPGLYEWVASFDFASLYPSIMRQWNISPENFLGILDSPPKDISYTKTSNDVYFDDTKKSAFSDIIEKYYNLRKSTKNEMKDVHHDIHIIEQLLSEN